MSTDRELMRKFKRYLGGLEEAIRNCPPNMTTELGMLKTYANAARAKIEEFKQVVDAETNKTWEAVRNTGGTS